MVLRWATPAVGNVGAHMYLGVARGEGLKVVGRHLQLPVYGDGQQAAHIGVRDEGDCHLILLGRECIVEPREYNSGLDP